MQRVAPTAAEPILCPNCDESNAGDAAFCNGCGAALGSPAAPAPARPQRGPACPACGRGNPPGALYCVSCGGALRAHAPAHAAPPLQPQVAGVGPGTTVVQHIYVGAAGAPSRLPLLVRALWFVFVGLWAGQLWLVLAWMLNLTLIGMPLGMWMLGRLPEVMTLRQSQRQLPAPTFHSSVHIAVRAIYFLAIGWWLSLLWLMLAWGIAATIIGLPLAFLMFERVGTLTTLAEG